MKKILLLISVQLLVFQFNYASSTSLKRSPSAFRLPPANSQQISNTKLDVVYSKNEFEVVKILVEKFGYQRDEAYNRMVIDVSYPSYVNYLERLKEKESKGSSVEIDKYIDNMNKSLEDQAGKKIMNELFLLENLTEEQLKLLQNSLQDMWNNQTGQQQLMTLLLMKEFDTGSAGKDCKIKIHFENYGKIAFGGRYKTAKIDDSLTNLSSLSQEEFSYKLDLIWDNEDKKAKFLETIELHLNGSIEINTYDGRQLNEISRTLSHELGHYYHHMIMGELFYNFANIKTFVQNDLYFTEKLFPAIRIGKIREKIIEQVNNYESEIKAIANDLGETDKTNVIDALTTSLMTVLLPNLSEVTSSWDNLGEMFNISGIALFDFDVTTTTITPQSQDISRWIIVYRQNANAYSKRQSNTMEIYHNSSRFLVENAEATAARVLENLKTDVFKTIYKTIDIYSMMSSDCINKLKSSIKKIVEPIIDDFQFDNIEMTGIDTRTENNFDNTAMTGIDTKTENNSEMLYKIEECNNIGPSRGHSSAIIMDREQVDNLRANNEGNYVLIPSIMPLRNIDLHDFDFDSLTFSPKVNIREFSAPSEVNELIIEGVPISDIDLFNTKIDKMSLKNDNYSLELLDNGKLIIKSSENSPSGQFIVNIFKITYLNIKSNACVDNLSVILFSLDNYGEKTDILNMQLKSILRIL
jgi:hypothetical protein